MLPETWQQCMENTGMLMVNTELSRMLEFMNNQWKREISGQEPLKINDTSNKITQGVRRETNQIYQIHG